MSTDPDHLHVLADALARLQAVDPRIRGEIIGDVLHLVAPGMSRDEASKLLFDSVHPLRAPRGTRFEWREVQS